MKRGVVLRGGAVLLLLAVVVFLGGSVLLAPDPDLRAQLARAPQPVGAGRGREVGTRPGRLGDPAAPAVAPDAAAAAANGGDADAADAELELEEEAEPATPGVVVLQQGQPVVGARVRAYRRGQVGGRPLREGYTDAAGRLELTDADADAVLVAEAPGIGVAAGEDGVGQLELTPDDLVIPGRVIGPQGEGVAARVRLLVGAFALSETECSPDGAFALSAPSELPMEASLEVTAPGYYPERVPAEQGLGLIELRRGDSGRVLGAVVDAHGQPLAEVLVKALTSERSAAATQTDVDGRFDLDGVRAGTVDLEVYLEGEVPVAVTTVTVEPGQETQARLVVRGQGSLLVSVRDTTGSVEGARVSIVDPTTTRFGGFSASGAEQEQTSDATGEAHFQLPEGRFYVRVRYRGAEASAEAVVEAGAEAGVQVDLSQRRSLQVRVVDGDGNPVQGVYMDVSLPSIKWESMPSGTSGPDGVVTFDALPAGLAGVHLGKGGQWRMVYTEAEQAELVWTEPSQLQLLGVVRDQEGELLAASVLPDTVKMEHLQVAQGTLEATLTPPDGARDVWLLAPDADLAPAHLGLAAQGQPELVGLDVSFQPAGVVRGRMIQAGTQSGVPGEVRLEGTLAGALEARAQWLGGTDHDPWITVNEWGQSSGSDGSFELGGLPPGSHTLTFRGVGCAPRSVEVTVEAGAALDLGSVELQPSQ